MPDYALDTHTKPHGFRVGIGENVEYSRLAQTQEMTSKRFSPRGNTPLVLIQIQAMGMLPCTPGNRLAITICR
jgi:hypothetical protein